MASMRKGIYIRTLSTVSESYELASLPYHKFYADEAERRKWQNSDSILTLIGLKVGYTFVDVGCGDGFFTIPASKIVGKNGRVFALDSDQEAIASLKKKALMKNLSNIEARVGAAEDTVFCEACADMVFYSIVLHDFGDPVKVLVNARKMLKPDGRLVDLDWKKQQMEFGPPLSIRLSEEQATGLIERAGFRIGQRKEASEFLYLIVAKLCTQRSSMENSDPEPDLRFAEKAI